MKISKKILLNNKIIYILGGNGLLGSSIVEVFSETAKKIVILDLNKNKKNLKNSNVFYYKFDCKNQKSFNKEFTNIFKKFGVPNVFINTSYPVTNDWKKNNFKEITLRSFQKNLVDHQGSYCWAAKIVADKMKENTKKNSSIIQFGSIYGILGQNLYLYENTKLSENMSYSIIKGGITNFTRQMAAYYGRNNIRVNTICLGGVEGHVKGSTTTQPKKFLAKYRKLTPLQRLAKPEDAAFAALFLASDASSYITGTTLMVDGGYSII